MLVIIRVRVGVAEFLRRGSSAQIGSSRGAPRKRLGRRSRVAHVELELLLLLLLVVLRMERARRARRGRRDRGRTEPGHGAGRRRGRGKVGGETERLRMERDGGLILQLRIELGHNQGRRFD